MKKHNSHPKQPTSNELQAASLFLVTYLKIFVPDYHKYLIKDYFCAEQSFQ